MGVMGVMGVLGVKILIFVLFTFLMRTKGLFLRSNALS